MAISAEQGSTCPVCGSLLRFHDFRAHMRANHPEYVAAEARKNRDERVAMFKILGPGLLIWLAAVVVIFLYFSTESVAIVGLFGSMLAITGWAALYAHRATKADAASMDSLSRECRICGVTMDGAQMKQHLQVAHPEEIRYLREARMYGFAVLAAIASLMLFLWYLLFPYLSGTSYRSFGQIVTNGGFFLWMGRCSDGGDSSTLDISAE